MLNITHHRIAFFACNVAICATLGCASLQAQDSLKTIVPILNYTADLVVTPMGESRPAPPM